MNSFSIIKMNLKNNSKKHILYIIAMIFAVSTYYNFWNLLLNPQVSQAKNISLYIQASGTMTLFFMILFFIFFIVYSSNFFLNEKKKEIGLYSLMGIDNKKLALIFASEELILGIISIISGLVIGILFSKLFMMILAHIALLNIIFKFHISVKALIITAVTFITIFSISFIIGYIKITKMTLVDLLYSDKAYEHAPKIRRISGFLSIIVLIGAYAVALSYKKIGFVSSLYGAVFLVIIGSVLFFRSFFTSAVNRIINNKKLLYRNTKLVSYSNVFFRIKDNYKTLSAICILITATITSLATVLSVKYYVDKNYETESPYTISYISSDSSTIRGIDELIKQENAEIVLNSSYRLIEHKPYSIISFSTFEKMLNERDYKYKDKIINKYKLDNDSVIYIDPPKLLGTLAVNNTFNYNGKDYSIKKVAKIPTFGLLLNYSTVVFSDEEYEKFKHDNTEIQFNGIQLAEKSASEKSKELSPNVNEHSNTEIKITSELFEKYPDVRIYTSVMNDLEMYNLAGIVFFLGAFMCLVFIFATGSIMYFKIAGEALKEKHRFKILAKIGMTDSEMTETVKDQVRLYYISPFILGVIHSSVAITVLSNILEFTLYIPMILSIIILALIMYVFYRFTVKNYLAKII